MADPKRADQYDVGESFEPLEFEVTREFNENFLHAVEDLHPRYMQGSDDGPPMVHPALFVNFSNVTRSPSFFLPPGMAAIHSHESVEFHAPGSVGRRFTVSWNVVEKYERRGRLYQAVETPIVDDSGSPVLIRVATNTYMGGPYRSI